MQVLEYRCGVLNCGSGKCVHKLLEEVCPYCGMRMVEVTTTGFKFCSNPNTVSGCDYEVDAPKNLAVPSVRTREAQPSPST